MPLDFIGTAAPARTGAPQIHNMGPINFWKFPSITEIQEKHAIVMMYRLIGGSMFLAAYRALAEVEPEKLETAMVTGCFGYGYENRSHIQIKVRSHEHLVRCIFRHDIMSPVVGAGLFRDVPVYILPSSVFGNFAFRLGSNRTGQTFLRDLWLRFGLTSRRASVRTMNSSKKARYILQATM
jgi:hypothetical protein